MESHWYSAMGTEMKDLNRHVTYPLFTFASRKSKVLHGPKRRCRLKHPMGTHEGGFGNARFCQIKRGRHADVSGYLALCRPWQANPAQNYLGFS